MFSNFLPKALFISLTIHTMIVGGSFFLYFPKAKKMAVRKSVEISYKPEYNKKVDVREHPIKPAQKLDLKNASIRGAQGTIPIRMATEQGLTGGFMVNERKRELHSTPMVHRVTVSPITSEKINNPAYAAYNEMVRSRIEERVYANYRKMEGGSVYLTFVVGSDGSLRASQIIDEKTRATKPLKELSLRSLQQAVFPPFLKGMTLPEYTFNIEIQYQVRD
jgi:hypothetical protein